MCNVHFLKCTNWINVMDFCSSNCHVNYLFFSLCSKLIYRWLNFAVDQYRLKNRKTRIILKFDVWLLTFGDFWHVFYSIIINYFSYESHDSHFYRPDKQFVIRRLIFFSSHHHQLKFNRIFNIRFHFIEFDYSRAVRIVRGWFRKELVSDTQFITITSTSDV